VIDDDLSIAGEGRGRNRNRQKGRSRRTMYVVEYAHLSASVYSSI